MIMSAFTKYGTIIHKFATKTKKNAWREQCCATNAWFKLMQTLCTQVHRWHTEKESYFNNQAIADLAAFLGRYLTARGKWETSDGSVYQSTEQHNPFANAASRVLKHQNDPPSPKVHLIWRWATRDNGGPHGTLPLVAPLPESLHTKDLINPCQYLVRHGVEDPDAVGLCLEYLHMFVTEVNRYSDIINDERPDASPTHVFYRVAHELVQTASERVFTLQEASEQVGDSKSMPNAYPRVTLTQIQTQGLHLHNLGFADPEFQEILKKRKSSSDAMHRSMRSAASERLQKKRQGDKKHFNDNRCTKAAFATDVEYGTYIRETLLGRRPIAVNWLREQLVSIPEHKKLVEDIICLVVHKLALDLIDLHRPRK